MMKLNVAKFLCIFCLGALVNIAVADNFVNPQQKASFTLTDSTITHAVENKIMRNRSFPHLNVRIFTDQGKVYLDGYVNSAEEATNLVSLVKTVDGVKSVDTAKLEIK